MKYIYHDNVSKNKYIRKILVCILIFLCFIAGKTAHSQNCLADVLHNPLYSNSNDIINGTKWIYEKKYLGSPLLVENYWPKANILYKGVQYSGVFMNFDLYKNQVIVFDPEKDNEKYVVVSMDYLSGFSFTDSLTGMKHTYEYFELAGTKGKELYENASANKIPLFIRAVKTVEARSGDKDIGKFLCRYDYYLGTESGFVTFRSKKQFVQLLATHSNELNRYIRKKGLKINNQHPENIITVLKYFDTLN